MSEEEDQSIPYLTSPAEVVSVAEKETVFDLARDCIDQDCGYWSLPPPEFLLPPPPKPPFMLEDCATSPLASAKDPEVTGFSHPSAVVSTADEHPAGTTFYGVGGRDVEPFEEVCDNFVNPLVLDESEVFVKDRLFNLLVIVICSIVLVGIILTVAIIIWRRFYLTRRTGLLVSKNVNSPRADLLETDPNNRQNNAQNQNYFSSMSSSEGKDSCNFGIPSDCGNWRNRRRENKQLPAALEMATAPAPPVSIKNSCHVYTNPNYPHSSLDVCGTSSSKQIVEIGGLPFYLTSGKVAETSLSNNDGGHFIRSPVLQSPIHNNRIPQDVSRDPYHLPHDYVYEEEVVGGHLLVEDELPSRELVRSPLAVRGGGDRPRPYFPPPPPNPQTSTTGIRDLTKDFYEDEVENMPIYEDIDRMCSYTGPPPTSPRQPKETKTKEKKKRKSKKSEKESTDIENSSATDSNERTYYNVPVDARVNREEQQHQPHGNVIVNPMMSPAAFHSRLRTMSPATRAPPSPFSTRLAAASATLSSSQSTPTKNSGGGSSMYYYSDTLKHNRNANPKKGPRPVRDLQNGGRVDSDSGISVSRADFQMDEMPTPSMRQQILLVNPSSPAITSLTSSPSSSPISTSTASPRGGGCTSPIRGFTSPSNILSPRNSQKQVIQKYV